jgi:hypothetical protein
VNFHQGGFSHEKQEENSPYFIDLWKKKEKTKKFIQGENFLNVRQKKRCRF